MSTAVSTSPATTDAALQAQTLWNEQPCGTGDYLAGLEYGSLAFFDEVRRSRYEDTDPWMKRVIPFEAARGKKLLEIGYGMGSDLLTFAEHGAEVHGIDITEEHYWLASRNFKMHGRKANLRLCDAAALDYPSESFDVVYSHGVLHHASNTVRCISEAYRVLKPGGLLILSLYHTYSAFHLFSMLLYRGILKGDLKRLGYRGLMSTVENGADGVTVKPLVKTYSRRQLRAILEDFSRVEFRIAHFRREHIPILWRLIPRFMERWLEPYLGWYVIAFATR